MLCWLKGEGGIRNDGAVGVTSGVFPTFRASRIPWKEE